jgi:Zn-dependent peptidase ImmA (M78 family)
VQIAGFHDVIKKADAIVRAYDTRDADKIARELGVIVLEYPFSLQKGFYTIIKRNRFAILKNSLDPVTRSIVLLHELGHDQNHRREAAKTGGFCEFSIFSVCGSLMEREANIFASQISLPDDDVLECIDMGYDSCQIAEAMGTDANLVALKIDTLISQGHLLRPLEHKNDFLKHSRSLGSQLRA